MLYRCRCTDGTLCLKSSDLLQDCNKAAAGDSTNELTAYVILSVLRALLYVGLFCPAGGWEDVYTAQRRASLFDRLSGRYLYCVVGDAIYLSAKPAAWAGTHAVQAGSASSSLGRGAVLGDLASPAISGFGRPVFLTTIKAAAVCSVIIYLFWGLGRLRYGLLNTVLLCGMPS